ncbi:hypothetical protein DFR70_1011167 [Nocardia tenerifensis]|uniref:Aspartate carbamoyl transferase n=1 Tax=Nocardia tenerifensis TaxID=228006 RepID=A0A318KHU3_9NOCA|nr:hypothetical protein [Nocardia tenerifensis]PXX71733.1 hypothetical protein DFR70_1011167 [Nocardia tenerifensis]
MATNIEPTGDPLIRPLRGLALGRIALGAASIAVPRALMSAFGIRATPELTYLTRIFGARAIALGLGYLTAPIHERPRWQRIALMVDIIDTTHGAAHVARGDVPRATAVALTAFTGGYMAVGAIRLARDLF